ncbi:hypothetical protein [Nocardioides daejeonensis]|uniref:hypothetical protein n=1 Tax=Nocardioides daejeonensis TaxID=1046556 RepID=UPI000D74E5B6|nr:hypothetical protein [Nocardioides daejeonensis]
MTDESDHGSEGSQVEETPTAVPGVPGTGNPAVDRVLGEVAGVGGRPLTEHVATFERAHESLRAALDSPRG